MARQGHSAMRDPLGALFEIAFSQEIFNLGRWAVLLRGWK